MRIGTLSLDRAPVLQRPGGGGTVEPRFRPPATAEWTSGSRGPCPPCASAARPRTVGTAGRTRAAPGEGRDPIKAWQFIGTHQPLTLNEVAEPVAGEGEVVVDIRAAGLCHSDVGILTIENFLPPFVRPPLTIGHEIAGVIAAVGQGVSEWRVGDRVGVCQVGDDVTGITRDGGYAPKVRVGVEVLLGIPDSVSFEQAAAGNDAGMTAQHAMVVDGEIAAGQRVGVIGLGGVGQIGARIAVLNGCTVYAAEIKRSVWPLAADLGVTRVVDDISELAGVDLDLVVDFAGFGTTTAAAIETVRHGGRVVQVGLGRLNATISIQSLVMKEITLKGCLGGTMADTAAVYDLMASGALEPLITTTGFDDIRDGLERLERGEVVGRLVATYPAA
ncbi:zinc-binding dehydrogenase [Herbiconiux daphne]|uniref:Zinc-binding dehydrogenase n=1 Tax=Herbiconiux daphne TaxID=2970914 RepID=A0ABT2H3L3_9MICO|nr:zinc-binding dehydrogenase [Herbiconiux daphne]MCS5734512.1 zinc-binding dehydrogenase [Herbiconiux daphne]